MAGPERLQDDLARQIWRHGPIELVIDVQGEAAAIATAHARAWARFGGVLEELVAELAVLRAPTGPSSSAVGPVARRMIEACRPHAADFITPMAAVAGSVAEEVVAFYARPGIARASVNNGGDIALFLASGRSIVIGVVPNLEAPGIDATLAVDAADTVRGVATSGWRGRSFSLGIADSVTVLARTAAAADAAATIIGNAVCVDHPAVARAPASSLKDDSDLGDRLVTVSVGALPAAQVESALDRGAAVAHACAARGLIAGAALALQGRWRTIGSGFPQVGTGRAAGSALTA